MKKILLLSLTIALLCWSVASATSPASSAKDTAPAKVLKADPMANKAPKAMTAEKAPVIQTVGERPITALPVINQPVQASDNSNPTTIAPVRPVAQKQETPQIIKEVVTEKQPFSVSNSEQATKYNGPGLIPNWYTPSMSTVNLLTEGFESGALPAGWTDVPGTSPWLYNGGTYHGPGSVHGGSFAAYFNIWDYSSGTEDNLITPSIDFSAHSGSYLLSFWWWHSSGTDYVQVLLSEGGVETMLMNPIPNSGVWTQVVIPFSSTSNDGKIIFRGHSYYGSYNLYVDDVSIDDAPSTGRCCYGDPTSPSCADNSQSECDALGGTWNPTYTCAGNPCPAVNLGDVCAAPIVIGSFPYTDTKNTADYLNDYNAHGNDIVYQFTLTEPMLMDFTMCNTAVGFDTWMGIWADGNCGTTNFVAYNDDDGCVFWGTSHIPNVILAAGTYYIDAEAYGSTNGTYTLDITAEPAPLAPDNDLCEDAQPIVAPYPVTVEGTTVGSTVDCPGVLNWNAVWYTIELPYAVNELTIDYCPTTAGAIPTIGVVYFPDCSCTGYQFFTYTWPTCESGLIEPRLAASIPGPVTIYYPAFVGAATMDFSFTVDVQEYLPPAADFTVTAPGSWTDGNTCGAGNDCNLQISEDQIWQVTIPTDGIWIFSLCNGTSGWDTWMALGTTACSQDLGYNDDFCGLVSQITAQVTAGDYFVTIEGYNGACGAYTLDVTEAPPAPWNDQCEAVTPVDLVDGVPVQFTGDNTGATNLNDCYAFTYYGNVWHAFTLPTCMDVTLDYCGTDPAFGNAWLNLAIGCPCEGFTPGGSYDLSTCPDGNVTIRWAMLPAGTYYYPVLNDPSNGAVGPYTINVTGIECPPPPDNDNCENAYDGGILADGVPVQFTGDNNGATVDCPSLGYREAWVTFTVEECMDIVIDYCGTTPAFSNVFIVMETSCPCPGTHYFGNSWAPTCEDGNWSVTWIGVQPGQYWYPILTDPAGAQGPYVINVTGTVCPPPPPNDNCFDVTPVELTDGVSVQFVGTNAGATNDCPLLTAPQAWEAFTINDCMDVAIDFCGTDPAFQTIQIVITPECPCGTLVYAMNYDFTTCPDGNGTIRYHHLPAGTYYIPVGVLAGARGPYVMNVLGTVCPPPPANDNCENAELVGEVEGLPWSTMDATFDGAGACMTSANIWYLYTAPANAPVTVSLCNSSFDTKLAVYDGNNCPTTPEPPTPEDLQGGEDFASATAITAAFPAAFNGTTSGYVNNYVPACLYTSAPDVVYSYTPSTDQVVNVSLCGSSYDTGLGIYQDDEFTEIGCNDDFCGLQSEVDGISMLSGHTYYIVVTGYSSNSGPYTLSFFAANYVLIDCNDDYCGLQSQLTFDAIGGNQYLIEVGGFSSAIGEGVLTISVPAAHDVSVGSIDSPRPGQLIDGSAPFDVIATIVNGGLNTETFNVYASDNHGFGSTYTGLTLDAGMVQQITFPNQYNPTVTCQDYNFSIVTQLAGDLIPENDAMAATIRVARVADQTFQNDTDVLSNAWYFYAADNLIAIQYTADADKQIDYLAARTYVDELGFPWPDGTADPYRLLLFLDEDADGYPDMDPVFEGTVAATGVSPSVAYSVLDCGVSVTAGQSFWVAFGNVDDAPAHGSEGIGQDEATDFPAAKWYRLDGVWTQGEQYAGDEMLRAYALTVGGQCDYVVGDANNSHVFNGLDVTYSVGYFKGGPPPGYTCACPTNEWYVAGDVNASCSFNGLDVTYMVSYFKGGPLCHPCADCPPSGLLLAPIGKPVQTIQNGSGQ